MNIKFNKFNSKSLALICENINQLYEGGISFIEIFELLEDTKINKKYKNSFQYIKNDIKNGISLSQAFDKFDIYPKFFVSMISVGEKSGRLSQVLKELNKYYSRICDVKSSIITATIYPIILFTLGIIMSIFMMINIIPTFLEVYLSLDKEIPKSFDIVVSFFNNFESNFLYNISVLFCWIIGIPFILYKVLLKKHFINLFRNIKVVKQMYEYISIVLLSLLINSGISISNGLDFCASLDIFTGIKENFKFIKSEISNGNTLFKSMEKSNSFSKYTLSYIVIGEKTGLLEKNLNIVENELYKKIQFKIKLFTEFIGPCLIIIMGLFIGSFVLIFIMPLFDVMI